MHFANLNPKPVLILNKYDFFLSRVPVIPWCFEFIAGLFSNYDNFMAKKHHDWVDCSLYKKHS